MIRIDATPETVLAWCTNCHYRELTTDRGTAWRRALAHVQSVHPEDRVAIAAAGRSHRSPRSGGMTGGPGP